jgi:hypothetical protein
MIASRNGCCPTGFNVAACLWTAIRHAQPVRPVLHPELAAWALQTLKRALIPAYQLKPLTAIFSTFFGNGI